MTLLSSPASPADSPEIRHQAWRERRLETLSAPDSWLGLVGLYWLQPGRNTVGSAPGSAVALPEGPGKLGELLWEGNSLLWRGTPGSGAAVTGGAAGPDGAVILHTDKVGEPSRVGWGDLVFFVIEREGNPAVRVRDLGWRTKKPFKGVDYFPYAPAWRIDAAWQGLAQPLDLEVQSVTGEVKTIAISAKAVFLVDGKEYSLLPLEVADDGIFFIFRDATCGRETYGGGRFLKTRPPAEGRVILDFNRAYNPPCAFTPFATCSLPPPENWLPLTIQAGERKYAGTY